MFTRWAASGRVGYRRVTTGALENMSRVRFFVYGLLTHCQTTKYFSLSLCGTVTRTATVEHRQRPFPCAHSILRMKTGIPWNVRPSKAACVAGGKYQASDHQLRLYYNRIFPYSVMIREEIGGVFGGLEGLRHSRSVCRVRG